MPKPTPRKTKPRKKRSICATQLTNGDKIDDAKKAEVEATIEPVKKALEADDDEQIKSAMEKLNEAMQAAATEMYAKAQAEAEAQQQAEPSAEGAEPAGEKKADGDVVDADYTMEDDDEKKD